MADISLKLQAAKLGKSLENLASNLESELNSAVKNLAQAAYTAMISRIQAMNPAQSNRQEYLKALKFKDLGNDSYLIYLDGEQANKLEKGYGSYSIREVLLKSTKTVQVGPRAGNPWVQKAKDGHKYAHVPFEHKPRTAQAGDLAEEIKKMTAQNLAGKSQRITRVFKDVDGNPVQGKVATVTDTASANLQGLVKYQSVSPKGSVSSLYMTYRTVSEAGKDWVHPGFKGYNLFKEAEDYVEKEMDNILQTVLK